MTSTDTIQIRAALGELVALATAVRADWTATEVQAALVDARNCGYTWAQALVGLSRLIVDPKARPAELVPPHPAQQRSTGRASSGANVAHLLAEARALCEEASAKLRTAERQRGEDSQ